MNSYEKYSLDKNEVAKVDKLPSVPMKYIYIYINSNDLENTTGLDYGYQKKPYRHGDIYINNSGQLTLASIGAEKYEVLLLFLKKYREYTKLLPSVLDNFDISDKEKEIQLKRMQIMLTPMKSLEDFRNALRQATEELPLHKELAYFGDGLMFVEKKEDLGNITDVFGEESPYAKKWLNKYNDSRWERGVVYNEQEGIYENCFVKERSNDWVIGEKFYEKQYLFEYLLNWEIQAIK